MFILAEKTFLDQVGGLLQITLTVLAVASSIGVGLMRGTVANLRSANQDLRDDLKDKDRRLNEAQAKQVLTDAKVEKLEGELEALSKVITGEAHWVAIGEQLDVHHSAASTHWNTQSALLEAILIQLGGRKLDVPQQTDKT